MRKIHTDDYLNLAVFLMDYHGGQWSRGYRLLCKLSVRGMSSSLCDILRAEPIYQYLVDNYGSKV